MSVARLEKHHRKNKKKELKEKKNVQSRHTQCFIVINKLDLLIEGILFGRQINMMINRLQSSKMNNVGNSIKN